MQANKWTSPTGQIRVYFNGVADRDVKVWIELDTAAYSPDFPKLNIRAARLVNRSAIEERVGRWIDDHRVNGLVSFAACLSAAN